MNNTLKVVLALATGVAAGFGIALLSTPKSGEEVREDIREAVLKANDTLQKKSSVIKDDVQQFAKKTVKDLEEKRSNLEGKINEKREEVNKSI